MDLLSSEMESFFLQIHMCCSFLRNSQEETVLDKLTGDAETLVKCAAVHLAGIQSQKPRYEAMANCVSCMMYVGSCK